MDDAVKADDSLPASDQAKGIRGHLRIDDDAHSAEIGDGRWIRTSDLRIMRPPRFLCASPSYGVVAHDGSIPHSPSWRALHQNFRSLSIRRSACKAVSPGRRSYPQPTEPTHTHRGIESAIRPLTRFTAEPFLWIG